MKPIIILGISAAFLGGASFALLVSYPIPENSIYVCFVALFIALNAGILGCWAIVLEATKRNRIKTDRIIEVTVDRLLKKRGLELVDQK